MHTIWDAAMRGGEFQTFPKMQATRGGVVVRDVWGLKTEAGSSKPLPRCRQPRVGGGSKMHTVWGVATWGREFMSTFVTRLSVVEANLKPQGCVCRSTDNY